MSGYGKREWAARALSNTGAGTVLRRLAGRGRIDILAYHRIWDMGDEATFPFDPELVSATPTEFRWQMEHVRRVGTPITFALLAEAIDTGAALPPRPIMVTFDDGHRDNYTHAFPILKALGVPATIFLSTGYVGKNGTFWFDRVAQLLFRAPEGPLRLRAISFQARLGADVPSRREVCERLLKALKAVPDSIRRKAMAELEGALGTHPPDTDAGLSGALNWDEAREMADSGMEFGSHTVSHPVLTRLEDEPLGTELTSSREAIEKNLGQPVTTLAYPVGGVGEFDARTVEAAQRAGYRFGVSYVSGTNKGLGEPYRLKRLHVERYTSRALFRAMLAAPTLFA